MRKEAWFGLSIMTMIVVAMLILLPPFSEMSTGHLGLLMLGLIVIAIMLGFPTAFTLMGMGVIFTWLAYNSRNPDLAWTQTLDLMVQRTYAVMANDVLISIPLFVFMGYLVERANLIERLFHSLQLAMTRIPGSLAVATIVTSAIFATATGIVGAVVTLMGLLALPGMLKAGYNVRLSAGAITAGGCLGILIPPSIMLIVYGATAGVSVVKLYAGAFFPGIMLAGLYVVYVVIVAKLKPHYAPPLSESQRKVPLAPANAAIMQQSGRSNVLAGMFAVARSGNMTLPWSAWGKQFFIALLPALVFAFAMGVLYQSVTSTPDSFEGPDEYQALGLDSLEQEFGGLAEPPMEGGLLEPPMEEPAADQAIDEATVSEAPLGLAAPEETLTAPQAQAEAENAEEAAEAPAASVPTGYWITLAIGLIALVVFYATLGFAQLEIFKMLLGSFFPLACLILAVLGSIVFGLATPSEAAALGGLGGLLLAAAYRRLNGKVLKESVFLTAKTSAMVCWLFVGSSIFSAAFALLGGQEIINNWVLSMELTPIQFMLLAQVIIFLLGWPLEWTEIIVIFMPIFVPLLAHFNIDPLFFGLMVALNLQTAFLSPPVAMSAFYLKGVAPPHVTLNQIFLGMLPFMGIQIIAMILLYLFPAIGLWLPEVMYR